MNEFWKIVARVPWWAAALLAPVTFFGLRLLGSSLQYVVPLLCFAVAGLSFADGVRRQRKIGSASREAESQLRAMKWGEFDRLIGEMLSERGFVFLAELGARPEAADVIAKQDEKRHLVHFRHWRAREVDLPAVRELFGIVAEKRMGSGIIITTGKFTDASREFVSGRNLELIDGYHLTLWMRKYSLGANETKPGSMTSPRDATDVVAVSGEHKDCPDCHSPMAVKTQRAGLTTGQKFWVCSRYPDCRGTRVLDE